MNRFISLFIAEVLILRGFRLDAPFGLFMACPSKLKLSTYTPTDLKASLFCLNGTTENTDIGTEELGHLEMIGAIVHQLTRNLSPEEIKRSGFDAYFVDHTTGVYPTAKEIKKYHPDVKVGGYSSCYILGKFENGRWVAGDSSYFTNFLEYVTKEKAPLDFFTYHGYLGQQYLEKIETESRFVRETLDRYGFTDTECIDAEWNVNICDIETDDRRTQNYINYRNEKGASHIAAGLYEMQRCPVDAAMYYDSQLWLEYGGLYHVPSLEPSKAYYAFKQFGELYEQKNECESHGGGLVYTCAASGEKKLLCISNISEKTETIKLEIKGAEKQNIVIYTLSKRKNYEVTYCGSLPESIIIDGYSFITIKFEK